MIEQWLPIKIYELPEYILERYRNSGRDWYINRVGKTTDDLYIKIVFDSEVTHDWQKKAQRFDSDFHPQYGTDVWDFVKSSSVEDENV